MDRAEISKEYATACQRIIDECGDDYRKGSEQILNVAAPDGLHPMLSPIIHFAYDIVDNYRGEEDDQHYWELIKAKTQRFLASEWEPTTWWAMVMYGFEEDGILKHSYSLSIRRHSAEMLYESGSDELVEAAKDAAGSINPRQTDEWFMYTLLQKLPKTVGKLTLQYSTLSEAATTEWEEV